MEQELSTFVPSERKHAKEPRDFGGLDLSSKIAVIGAGIMGACSAYYLRKRGYDVTLYDARGPGNSFSSSGGESRLLRLIYGNNKFYFDLTLKAIPLWMELQKDEDPFFVPSPVLWISGKKNKNLIEDSLKLMKMNEISYTEMSPAEISKRWPVIQTSDIEFAVMEELSGYLKAREACQRITKKFIDEGGSLEIGHIKPGEISGGKIQGIITPHGLRNYDFIVAAAGPWINSWSPAKIVSISRQEIHYFGYPPFNFDYRSLPSWIDLAYEPYFYGIPGDWSRGFKIACDERGSEFDPDTSDRTLSPQSLEISRKFLARRFPQIAKSPLVEFRVCQYSNTSDRNLICDIHPEAENMLLIGGGSGHSFKYGPALGNLVAGFLSGQQPLPAELLYF